jgi:hypothetical protein
MSRASAEIDVRDRQGATMHELKFKDISDLIAKWISILAAIFGGFIWLSTYVESKRETRSLGDSRRV